MQSRSSWVNFIPSPMMNPLFKMLWWVRTTPLGKPVVPLVYWMLTASSKLSDSSRSRSSSGLMSAALARRSSQVYMPL